MSKAMLEDAEKHGIWHWRNSMKTVRFFMFDAKAGAFILLLLMHARVWTLILAITANVIFYILERKGLRFASAIRAVRVWFMGQRRPATIFTERSKLKDSGGI